MTATSSSAENEVHLHALLDKHQKWLMQQPELLLLWVQDRQTRRRVAELLAKELLTIPVRNMENALPNRAMRKQILAQLAKADPTVWEGMTP